MANYALIDSEGVIINRVAIANPNDWHAPEGCSLVEEVEQGFDIGGRIIGGKYEPPSQDHKRIPVFELPKKVTLRQIRLAFHASGLLKEVAAAVAVADDETKISWEYASEIGRDDFMIKDICRSVGISDEDMDVIFAKAESIGVK